MRVLFLTHSFNCLAQRLFVELSERGHEVSVEFDINDAITTQAVDLWQPDLIIAPFLKRAIPERIWRKQVCLIVHPGIPGDRGPSALDWAILNGEHNWGVTVLQAEAEMDAGPIWASAAFPMRVATKSSLYRNEVMEAAVEAVLQAVERFESGSFAPSPLDYTDTSVRGRPQLLVKQADRAIDWARDDTDTVLRKIASADGMPGVRASLLGRNLYLYDAHRATGLGGEPGTLVAASGPAVGVATSDAAVWIGHLRDRESEHPFKLPATRVLAGALDGLPEVPLDSDAGYREIAYEEADAVGYLRFAFYNGAMSAEQCERLLARYREVLTKDTKVIVLLGGPDAWSNGMNLNLIEAANSTADESWRTINAIDDVAEAILRTESHLTVAALRANAGAGGVFLARACDRVWMRQSVILNPHYKDMGNLYGSEYWTYSLTRYAGAENATRITQARLPMGDREALALGLADDCFGERPDDFLAEVRERAMRLAASPELPGLLAAKAERRAKDETAKPLVRYREEELERMRFNFYGFDPSYHIARYNFVTKVPKSRTPVTIARHRDARTAARLESAS